MSRYLSELVIITSIMAVFAVAYFLSTDPERVEGGYEGTTTTVAQIGPFRGRPRQAPPAASKEVRMLDKDHEHFLDHDGRQRRYLVHVPAGDHGEQPLPVVLAFHGGMGNGQTQRTQSRLNEVADRQGFLVVYPDGTGLTRLLTFNAGTCCGYAVRTRVDDVGFVSRLLDELPKHYQIDSRRIYATGMSNGAMLCHRLACELSERIAAVAPISGTLALEHPQPPLRPVPILQIHGRRDENVPFEGGVGRNSFQRVPHRSVPETINFWVRANHCLPEPSATQQGDGYIRKEYRPEPGRDGASVILIELAEGGHTWPGGVDLTAHLGTGRLVTSVNASELIWQFFRQYKLP